MLTIISLFQNCQTLEESGSGPTILDWTKKTVELNYSGGHFEEFHVAKPSFRVEKESRPTTGRIIVIVSHCFGDKLSGLQSD